MTLAQKLERREAINSRIDALILALSGGVGSDGQTVTARSLSAEEVTELNQFQNELRTLEAEISALTFAEQQRAARAANQGRDKATSEEEKLKKTFSIGKAITEFRNRSLTGAEKEAHEEGQRISRDANLPTSGKGVLVPDFVLGLEQRTSTTAAPLAAGNTISTNQWPVMPGYSTTLGLEELGLMVLRGLTGINDIPVADLIAKASYVAEGANPIPSIDPNVRRPRLTARAVAAKSQMTLTLRAAADPILDQIILANLLNAEQVAVQEVVIKGGGTNQPVGILDSTDTQNLDLSAPGALTFEKIIDLINAPDNENAAFGSSFAFLTNAKVRAQLQKAKIDAGSGQMVWDRNTPELLNGYRALITNLVPKNGGVGTNESAIIFGNFSQMVLANWALREIVVDDISVDSASIIKMYSFWDQAFLNPKAFAKVRNILA